MSIYSTDLRMKVVGAYQRGEGSYAKLAQRFSVREWCVKQWVQRYRRTGSVEAQCCGPKPQDRTIWRVRLQALLEQDNSATLVE